MRTVLLLYMLFLLNRGDPLIKGKKGFSLARKNLTIKADRL